MVKVYTRFFPVYAVFVGCLLIATPALSDSTTSQSYSIDQYREQLNNQLDAEIKNNDSQKIDLIRQKLADLDQSYHDFTALHEDIKNLLSEEAKLTMQLQEEDIDQALQESFSGDGTKIRDLLTQTQLYHLKKATAMHAFQKARLAAANEHWLDALAYYHAALQFDPNSETSAIANALATQLGEQGYVFNFLPVGEAADRFIASEADPDLVAVNEDGLFGMANAAAFCQSLIERQGTVVSDSAVPLAVDTDAPTLIAASPTDDAAPLCMTQLDASFETTPKLPVADKEQGDSIALNEMTINTANPDAIRYLEIFIFLADAQGMADFISSTTGGEAYQGAFDSYRNILTPAGLFVLGETRLAEADDS